MLAYFHREREKNKDEENLIYSNRNYSTALPNGKSAENRDLYQLQGVEPFYYSLTYFGSITAGRGNS